MFSHRDIMRMRRQGWYARKQMALAVCWVEVAVHGR
jgi:hypothetical protein